MVITLTTINGNTNFWLEAYSSVWECKAFWETFNFKVVWLYKKIYVFMLQNLNLRSIKPTVRLCSPSLDNCSCVDIIPSNFQRSCFHYIIYISGFWLYKMYNMKFRQSGRLFTCKKKSGHLWRQTFGWLTLGFLHTCEGIKSPTFNWAHVLW